MRLDLFEYVRLKSLLTQTERIHIKRMARDNAPSAVVGMLAEFYRRRTQPCGDEYHGVVAKVLEEATNALRKMRLGMRLKPADFKRCTVMAERTGAQPILCVLIEYFETECHCGNTHALLLPDTDECRTCDGIQILTRAVLDT
jgi:hypothetical protein